MSFLLGGRRLDGGARPQGAAAQDLGPQAAAVQKPLLDSFLR
jgi:hypothetical protein